MFDEYFMVEGTILKLVPPAGGQPYTLHVEPTGKNWADPFLYAPAIPGVIVAILGLWLAHRLTIVRDRRKEILELCGTLKESVTAAEICAAEAWLSKPNAERLGKVQETKSKLQTLGVIATNLRRRTRQGLFATICYVFTDRPLSIDVLHEVARLRDIATGDPFEDPNRRSDGRKLLDIAAAAAEIHARVDLLFFELYS